VGLQAEFALDESAGGEVEFSCFSFEGGAGLGAAEGDLQDGDLVLFRLFGAAEFFAGAGAAGAAVGRRGRQFKVWSFRFQVVGRGGSWFQSRDY
jgi:hypothetical protein